MKYNHTWAADGGSSAQLPSATTLEFIDRMLRPVPDMVAPYSIEEIDVRPSTAFGKKGSVEFEASDEHEMAVTEFTAYPNPFTGTITFYTQGRPGSVSIYDIRGVLIAQMQVQQNNVGVYNGNNLGSGIYIAVFTDRIQQRSIFKIIKQ